VVGGIAHNHHSAADDPRCLDGRHLADPSERWYQVRDTFLASGELGHDLLAVDWESTPLGDPEGWPQSLETTVRILLSSKFAMWMAWGPDLTFLCNDAYRRDTLGKKYPWALGRPAREVWSEIWPDIAPRIESVMRTGVATWDEALQLFLERSGYVEETYHTFSYSPLADDSGRIAGMLCVVSEDTHEVVAQRRLRALQDLGSRPAGVVTEQEVVASVSDRLAANAQSLPFSLVYLLDDDLQCARLAGRAGLPEGHPAAPLLLDVADERPVWPVADLAKGTPTVVEELDEQFRDLPTGPWREPPTTAYVVPLLAQTGEAPVGFLVAGLNRYRPLDDSYQDFVELAANQIVAAITGARAYESQHRRADALAELDRAKTAFFTNVSHEFRTPLTLLLGPAEDALTDPGASLAPRQRRRLEIILDNGQRLLKLVNTLLDFSRLESGEIRSLFEPVDLARYTTELASMFESASGQAGLAFTVDCPPLPAPVHVDREHWAKIVLNLLSNAVEFTFTGGITVRLRAHVDRAELTVTDTGVGIDEADLADLFKRFHRVSGARSRTFEGSGIGLALVSDLARLHGGEATAVSRPGEGSTFTVSIPFGVEHLPADQVAGPGTAAVSAEQQGRGFLAEAMRWADEVDASRGAPSPAEDRGSGEGRSRILVVDDNPDMREYVTGLLAEEYVVDTAADGLEGLERARTAAPDLVLTDVMMPRLDGFGLLSELRGQPATRAVPVVMLSARAGEEGTVEGLEAGAEDYIVKPFTARELLARVRSNLELDRARRASRALEEHQRLLDQAQRLAGVGSWEYNLRTGESRASTEMLRILGRTVSGTESAGLATGLLAAIAEVVHPDERDHVARLVNAALEGSELSFETCVVRPDGEEREVVVHGELVRDQFGAPDCLRGSLQDVTEARSAQMALASVAASQEAAAREHTIADELQRSLLPPMDFEPEHVDVATYYRAGVEGTQVGGDWYDVIDLRGGRTALVVGDVMGRGVRAAAVMGQLRAAVRAYARLDLRPADLLEFLDGMVRELGEDQIVTCLYAVVDPAAGTLRYANAGHLPPLLRRPGEPVVPLTGAGGPPLGAGPHPLTEEEVPLVDDTLVTLYTDGLVEHRGQDIGVGIEALADAVAEVTGPLGTAPRMLVEQLLPEGPDDDVAVLMARVAPPECVANFSCRLEAHEPSVRDVRDAVGRRLHEWSVPDPVADNVVLAVSELVTNAILHGEAPIDLQVGTRGGEVRLEIEDRARFEPRMMRPNSEDEHGRGMQIVAAIADRWGSRPTDSGKCVWCTFSAAGRGHGATTGSG